MTLSAETNNARNSNEETAETRSFERTLASQSQLNQRLSRLEVTSQDQDCMYMEEIRDNHRQLMELTKKNVNLETAAKIMKDRNSILEKALEEQYQLQCKLFDEIKIRDTKIETLEKENKELENFNREKDQKIEELKRENEKKDKDYRSLEAKFNKLIVKGDGLQKQYDNLQKKEEMDRSVLQCWSRAMNVTVEEVREFFRRLFGLDRAPRTKTPV